MKRYIALLRGINISGKNKIVMSELKSELAKLGFLDVVTYLNSGNVVFSIDENDKRVLEEKIEKMIQECFDLKIPVVVIMQEFLCELLSVAPVWWGTDNKEMYDNLIFVMDATTPESIAEKVGEPTSGLEQIELSHNAIFWSFDRKNYAKANWWKKTASSGVGELITIRTANTLKKIAKM